MKNDYYQYLEKEHLLAGSHSGLRFRIGDPVRVRVSRVDLERRRIEFAPEGSAAEIFMEKLTGNSLERKRLSAGISLHRRGAAKAAGHKAGKSPHGGRRRR